MRTSNPAITYEDRGGDSPETAIIIHGAPSGAAGVHAEYEYLERKFGPRNVKWVPIRQKVFGSTERRWDMIIIGLSDGSQKKIYFDITEFFGKR
jgi:hypothetical protein